MLTTPLLRIVKNRQAANVATKRSVHIERRLAELGYVLPQVAEPKGNYRTAVRTGNFIFTGAFVSKNVVVMMHRQLWSAHLWMLLLLNYSWTPASADRRRPDRRQDRQGPDPRGRV